MMELLASNLVSKYTPFPPPNRRPLFESKNITVSLESMSGKLFQRGDCSFSVENMDAWHIITQKTFDQ